MIASVPCCDDYLHDDWLLIVKCCQIVLQLDLAEFGAHLKYLGGAFDVLVTSVSNVPSQSRR